MKKFLVPLKEKVFSKIDLDKVFHQVFSPLARPRIHKTFCVLLFSLSAYQGGKMLALFLTPESNKKFFPPSPGGTPPGGISSLQQQIESLEKSSLFKTQETPALADCKVKPKAPHCLPVKKKPDSPCLKANKKSSLPVSLLATIVLQDEIKSVASVQVRGGKGLLNLRRGEKIANLAQITAIHAHKMIIKNKQTGNCEFINLKQNKASQGNTVAIQTEREPVKGKKLLQQAKEPRIKVKDGNKFTIKKSLRDEMLGNISEILTQARAIQIKNPDGTLSFQMQEIVPGSIYTMLNISNGDIIDGINGKKFNNINEIMSLFGQLKEKNHYQINLRREGEEKTFEYNFE